MGKETLRLVRSFEIIGVESLNIKGMMHFSRNAKNYNDVSWYKFTSMLEWKSKFHNCVVVKADKFFASSQLCNNCGYKNKEVKNLSIRNWVCPKCGEVHNRDQNAAINLKNNALKELNKIRSTAGTVGTYACGGQGSKIRLNSNFVDCSLNQEERTVMSFIEAHRL